MVDRIAGAPPQGPTGDGPRPAAALADRAPGFDAALAAAEGSQIAFSKHALRRIEQRGLRLDAARMQRLEAAVSRAQEKGSRDTVILIDELALVVSVRNHTVITAIDGDSGKEQIFTNIDSVVLVP